MSLEGKPSVLITGGSGNIGRYLTSLLLEHGFRVAHLSRNTSQFGVVRVFRWNPEKNILDPSAFDGVDYVVHLAGADMGEKRWTRERKTEILNSRVHSAKLLHKVLTVNRKRLKAFISASGTGYYGTITSNRIFTEEDPSYNDFTGFICKKWEEAADLFSMDGIRTVKIRTGVVPFRNEGALSKMLQTEKYGFLARAGNGEQYMPWIHIADLCNVYLKAITDDTMEGPFNAVSPQHITHGQLIETLSRVLGRHTIMPVPSIVLNLRFGEMADIALKGSRVSSQKLIDSGFRFLYPEIYEALINIFSVPE